MQLRVLRQGSAEERIDACLALGKTYDPRAAKALLTALNDPDASLRRAAFVGLVRLDPEKAVDALRRLARDSDRRTSAIRDLIDLADRSDASAHALAALARLFVRFPESIFGLLKMLGSPSDRSAKQRREFCCTSVRRHKARYSEN